MILGEYTWCRKQLSNLALRLFLSLTILLLAFGSSLAFGQDLDDATIGRAKKATVMVWTLASRQKKADTALGTGTGYFINSTGLLITNNHVIDPAHGMSPRERQSFQYQTNRLTFIVIQNSGTEDERHWECDLVHQSMTADQALLQARTEEGELLDTPQFLPILPSWRLREELSVFAVGFPGGNRMAQRGRNAQASVSTGVITKIPRSTSGRVRRIETDAVARPGNSGGPMVDAEGYVVGTVTLLAQAEDQANTCALVPPSITRSFILDAMVDGRLPADTDLVPFIDVLTQGNRTLDIPSLKRMTNRDTLFIGNDDRVYGRFEDETIEWKSPLGHVAVPVEMVAYVLRYGERLYLVFENGDHLLATSTRNRLQFAAEGGTTLNKTYANISAIAFRPHNNQYHGLKTDPYVISSPSGRLVLSHVEGEVTLKSQSGEIIVTLDDIARIDQTDSLRRQIVTLNDGRVIKGSFGDETLKATMAGLNQPIDLRLNRVKQATIERIDESSFDTEGVSLVDIMRGADQELIDVAKALRAGDISIATTTLKPYLDKNKMKRMPSGLKAQVRLLDGIIALRSGKTNASKKIRKCVRANDPSVAAYARGCVEVLKRFGKSFEDKPLSDPDVFSKAGKALGRELIDDARALLKDREHLEGKRGEYSRYMNRIKKSERAMLSASVFAGPAADDVLMNLWKMALDLCRLESKRLIEEHHTVRSGRSRVSRTEWQRLNKISKDHDKLVVEWTDRYQKLREFGFYHAEEPDKRSFE